ncbi:hypothetical protein D3C72_1736290 [compost metagenome]
MACSSSGRRGCSLSSIGILPATSLSISSRSLINSLRCRLLSWAIVSICCMPAGTAPRMPALIRLREPAMAVSGVRSSWLTVETNSFFMRSMRLRSLMSRITAMKRRWPWWLICDTASSMLKDSPLWRRPVNSRLLPIRLDSPVLR